MTARKNPGSPNGEGDRGEISVRRAVKQGMGGRTLGLSQELEKKEKILVRAAGGVSMERTQGSVRGGKIAGRGGRGGKKKEGTNRKVRKKK